MDEEIPFDDVWYRQVPNVHRWLSGDSSTPFVLTTPHPMVNVDFWFAPFYLMRAILGWRDVAAGIVALRAAGSLVGPSNVLMEAWHPDYLDAIIRWADANWSWVTGCAQAKSRPRRTEFDRVGLDLGAGCDPKHLVDHVGVCTRWYQHSFAGERFASDDSLGDLGVEVLRSHVPPRLMLIFDEFWDWPLALGRYGSDLPAGPPSWHVHLVSRRGGYVGPFRRCWECGWWFQGPARFHRLGHVLEAP